MTKPAVIRENTLVGFDEAGYWHDDRDPFESVLEWARSLDPTHDCQWEEYIPTKTGYDPIYDRCILCGVEKPTMLVRRWG